MFNKTKLKFDDIFDGLLSDDEIREYLISLYEKGEDAEDIAGAASAMREHSVLLPIPYEFELKLVDNCGTGGDKSSSFNVSSTVSLLLAACGCYVAKHGNRSVTSNSGSADMLEALGVNLNVDFSKQVQMLTETGFIFMFAVNHHPAMARIMPIRKSIPHRTIFNILGPLTNPAGAVKQLIGVFDKEYIHKMVEALKLLGAKRVMVVSSADGLDEISISDVTYATTLIDGVIEDLIIDPRDYGFEIYPFDDIKGGSAKENAAITRGILEGTIKGAKLDIVLLNTAAALLVDGMVDNMYDGIKIAKEAIESGKAKEKLEQIIEVSQGL